LGERQDPISTRRRRPREGFLIKPISLGKDKKNGTATSSPKKIMYLKGRDIVVVIAKKTVSSILEKKVGTILF